MSLVWSGEFCLLRSREKLLFRPFGQVAEIVIIRLHELPDDRHGENHHKANGGPNRNRVIAHLIVPVEQDPNGKTFEKAIIGLSRFPAYADASD